MDRTAVHCIHIRCKIWRVTCTDSLTQIPANSAHTHRAFSGQDLRRPHLFLHDVRSVHFVQLQHITSQYMIEKLGKTICRYKQHCGRMLKTHAKSVSDVKHKSRVLRKMTGRITPGIQKQIMKHLPCCLNKKDPTPQDRHICYLLPNCEINLWTYAANMCKNDVDFCCQN